MSYDTKRAFTEAEGPSLHVFFEYYTSGTVLTVGLLGFVLFIFEL